MGRKLNDGNHGYACTVTMFPLRRSLMEDFLSLEEFFVPLIGVTVVPFRSFLSDSLFPFSLPPTFVYSRPFDRFLRAAVQYAAFGGAPGWWCCVQP